MPKIIKIGQCFTKLFKKIKVARFYRWRCWRYYCFRIVYLPAARTKNILLLYLNTDFSHAKNFFWNILLKIAWLCDIRLQNYGTINFLPFFWTTLYIIGLVCCKALSWRTFCWHICQKNLEDTVVYFAW